MSTIEYPQPQLACGLDERARVADTTQIPWRCTCELLIHHRNGLYLGTGFFIAPRVVLTAGHNVYSHAAGGWARRIQVLPGLDGAYLPYGSVYATDFRSVGAWVRDANVAYDVGALILDSPAVGERVGHFGIAALADAELKNLLVSNAGYPRDKPSGTMWYTAGRITGVTPQRLSYMLDTEVGNSGSPIWYRTGDERLVVGIHNYGICPNRATRITPELHGIFHSWIPT